MGSSFDSVINEHLELRRRNAALEAKLPLDRYRSEEATSNHSLFRPEADALLEETQEHVPEWVASGERETEIESWIVREAPSFDWGD
jgi:hypothetical protein